MSIPLCTVLHMATSLTWHSPPCCIVDTTLLGGTTLPSQVWQHSGITVSSSQNILEREPSLSSQGRDLQMNSIQPEQVRKDWPSWYPTPAKITLPYSKDRMAVERPYLRRWELWTKDSGSPYGGLEVCMVTPIKIDSLGGLKGPKAFLPPPARISYSKTSRGLGLRPWI